MLAQFSMARARDTLSVAVAVPVLTSPDSAVACLRDAWPDPVRATTSGAIAGWNPAARRHSVARMNQDERTLRQAIIDQCLWMNASGLNQGTSGNISVRHARDMLITPSSVPYADLTPEMICAVPLDDPDSWKGPRKPSSEWRFHRDILAARPELNAIVHTHATHCTALAICRRDIPAAHYMIAAFGGAVVRCSGFAIFGTQELSDTALAALEGRNACLLANHGAIACGPNLDRAMWLASELETLARQYILALQIGDPVILDDAAIALTAARFGYTGYGEVEP